MNDWMVLFKRALYSCLLLLLYYIRQRFRCLPTIQYLLQSNQVRQILFRPFRPFIESQSIFSSCKILVLNNWFIENQNRKPV